MPAELAPRPARPRSMPAPASRGPRAASSWLAGRKVVGSAQLRQGGALLQHGSILLADDQAVVSAVTRGDAAPLDLRGPAPRDRRHCDSTTDELAGAISDAAERRWRRQLARRTIRGRRSSPPPDRHAPRFRSTAVDLGSIDAVIARAGAPARCLSRCRGAAARPVAGRPLHHRHRHRRPGDAAHPHADGGRRPTASRTSRSPISSSSGSPISGPTSITSGDKSFVPLLAKSWTRRDSVTLAFDLDERAKWQDGVPVTARDVVFTFERARDPAIAPRLAELLRRITSVTAEGDRRVVFQFSRAYAEQIVRRGVARRAAAGASAGRESRPPSWQTVVVREQPGGQRAVSLGAERAGPVRRAGGQRALLPGHGRRSAGSSCGPPPTPRPGSTSC